MTLDELLSAAFPNPDRQPSDPQRRILSHREGPAWVSAGPGSGKTDTLALFALRLLYVDEDPVQAHAVLPDAIVVTTFTEKAARNIEDRISLYRGRILDCHPELATRDTSKLRVETLHGLCNDFLQEFRAPTYQNVRLMDEFESAMFVYEHVPFARQSTGIMDPDKLEFWRHFSYVFKPLQWKPEYDRSPRRWEATRALLALFNRIVEGRSSLALMRAAGGAWKQLADLYDGYAQALVGQNRCDFAHLQLRFLEFLATPSGHEFRDGSAERDGIRWVLVDEYQDTNLLQEEIYLKLADRAPYNIIVVGDDDQALYRFRGASVECMVTFDDACATYLGIEECDVEKYPLVENFRSHPQIVTFCNDFIAAFASMSEPGSRVAGKPLLVAKSGIEGAYDAVGLVQGRKASEFADLFAATVADLHSNGVIEDYSQCCLLLRSTKETPQNAGPYVAALRAHGIPYYNPRNKAFLQQQEVLGLLGALISFTDPDAISVPTMLPDITDLVTSCRTIYATLATAHPTLRAYIDGAVGNIGKHPNDYVPTALQELLYLILALEPFKSWAETDPAKRTRLAQITSLIEGFASLPVPDHPKARRGSMTTAPSGQRGVLSNWNKQFYNLFFGYLTLEGVNEEEDDDVIVPPGRVPIMTIHQAKGLEFPFVFVGHVGATSDAEAKVYRLEDDFATFAGNPDRTFLRAAAATRAELDLIRQFFVAYSRAQWGLMLVGSPLQFKKGGVPCGPTKTWLRYHAIPL